MAISDVEAVDAVGIEPETGNAMLVITDDLDWSDPGHLNALQQKVTAYSSASSRAGSLNSPFLEAAWAASRRSA